MLTFGTIFLIIASVVWGVVHSALASHTVKGWLRRVAGAPAFDRLYRLAYNVFSLSSLYPIVAMLYIVADQPLYTIPSPWVYLTVTLQALAAIMLISAVVQTGVADFLGLSQWYNDTQSKPPTLMMDGWYSLVRHPLYLGILVFAWLIPEMTVNRLALLVTFTLYILIGAWFEERKLLKDFGPAYAEYKARVPMLLPKITNRKS
jgi:protein-S-isoprenylcysteine O-methyltransferase Ste14